MNLLALRCKSILAIRKSLVRWFFSSDLIFSQKRIGLLSPVQNLLYLSIFHCIDTIPPTRSVHISYILPTYNTQVWFAISHFWMSPANISIHSKKKKREKSNLVKRLKLKEKYICFLRWFEDNPQCENKTE